VVVLLVAAAAVVLLSGDDDGGENAGPDETTDETTDGTGASTTAPPDGSTTTSADLAAGCDRTRQVCITSIEYQDGTDPLDGAAIDDGLVARYETDLPLTLPTSAPSVHAHFYLSPTITAETSGTNGGAGGWNIWATSGEYSPFAEQDTDGEGITRADVGTNTQLCVTVADEHHAVPDPTTEHCVDLPT
jgi:hypothetical protein